MVIVRLNRHLVHDLTFTEVRSRADATRLEFIRLIDPNSMPGIARTQLRSP
jgi:hypothetical protein